jgi:hypothetical protein
MIFEGAISILPNVSFNFCDRARRIITFGAICRQSLISITKPHFALATTVDVDFKHLFKRLVRLNNICAAKDCTCTPSDSFEMARLLE